ncbi:MULTISPECIES: GGDEF domain-containing protein [unclassified Pseudomonas]|uniref:GGDEF domain-containing protein n=1 Tax=unclassified Pseudomonas TaxID=196821 RepID=UPI000C86E0F7|nr:MULTISPECIES: GGDEF domain-containing protein [unclassified Pseudomonas]PMV21267.1 GGDEF domain-containing protein [Pseudomonas sp. FW305-3-2-15-C-TSA2]PMV25665.1 GGDEF domain-containing protein [Pseudomonas sp. DP16D-L5]PMV37908.1 GGDEF domain-containing protein [Pseudomonas sp. FW305-3-2-15-A-LB2]PMV44311.1 GGDEF domain-containing protein [Pseudomonas sp. FW305-3-2-15-C-R2A1]PMV45816.1 GGDEF domain-containing protein [Pseudomonas sp. FW305-3-2-15-C-LB1]
MTLDPPTILALTVALAAAAALYLAVEWRSVREPSLLCWSAGFATITVGSTLALLRLNGLLMIGIWFANGLLVTAHFLFLLGVARFTQTRLSPVWLLMLLVWLGMLMLPADPSWSKAMLAVQSLLVVLPTLRASFLLRPHGKSLSIGAVQLRYVLLIHGAFYVAKALSVLIPGTLIDLAAFKGEIIQISLVEGAMAIMLIALSMTGSERYRREQQIARLAARDPLTALYNRRALDLRAPRLLAQVSPAQPGALLLIDIDNFKSVNDLHGHSAGDRLLVALSEMIRSVVPQGALAARLGGDEFVILLNPASTEQIVELGSSLRDQFQQLAAQHFTTPAPVTLSIGANLFDQPPPSLTALIEQGDTTLYESKRGGRDSIRLVDRTGASPFG